MLLCTWDCAGPWDYMTKQDLIAVLGSSLQPGGGEQINNYSTAYSVLSRVWSCKEVTVASGRGQLSLLNLERNQLG